MYSLESTSRFLSTIADLKLHIFSIEFVVSVAESYGAVLGTPLR